MTGSLGTATLVAACALAVVPGGSLAAAAARPLATSARGLDTSFGSSGVSALSGSYDDSAATAVATVPACPPKGTCAWSAIAGDVVAAGSAISGATGEYVVEALGSNSGKPVTAFGSSGVTSLFTGVAGSTGATAVAVYPPCPSARPSCPWSAAAGDVVVAGTTGTSVGVAELSPTGAVLWHTTVAAPAGESYGAAALTLEVTGTAPTGDVVVAGNTQGSGPETPLLAALTPSGSLDTAFGGGTGLETGFILPAGATTPAGELLTGIAADPAGDLVLAGTYQSTGGSPSMFAARDTPAGAADTTFGDSPSGCSSTSSCAGSAFVGTTVAVSGGMALAPLAATSASCAGLASTSPCYDVLVAGTATAGSIPAPILGAVGPEGGVEAGFDRGGTVSLPASNDPAGAEALAVSVQAAGHVATGVAVSGTVLAGSSSQNLATVTRLSPSGSLVRAFGSGGVLTLPSAITVPGSGAATAAAPDNLDFFVAGTFASSSGFAVARVLGEVLSLSVSISGPRAGWVNADQVTLTLNGAEAPVAPLGVTCSLAGPSTTTFAYEPPRTTSPPPKAVVKSAIVTLGSGHASATEKILALEPAFVGGSSLKLSLGCKLAQATPVLDSGLRTHTITHAAPLPQVTPGYWLATSTGRVSAFRVPSRGDASPSSSPYVGLAVPPQGGAYWLVTASGKVTGRGVASLGSITGHLASPIVAIVADPATGGYWLVSRDGAVTGFGAPSFGQPKSTSRIVGAAAAPDGLGYFMLGVSGAVSCFGPGAVCRGSAKTAAVAIAADPLTGGYYVTGSTGSVSAFGAPSHGSTSTKSVTSISVDPATGGYWLVTSAGKVIALGAPWYGSGSGKGGATVAIAGR